MFGIGHTELLVVAFVALILFGNRLPGVMRSLGQSVTEFRRGLHPTDES
ncbi:MAG: twin-arginine translocase TatA/TatE family subunit [Planctomycetota bacterium]|nr:twin-arginine translocase TatA/TatE family subunit [Planctomycetota bacterium]